MPDDDICISGFNVYHCDRAAKGGGVAIYIKSSLWVNVIQSISLPKQLNFLALKVKLASGLYITVVGYYRSSSATPRALQTLKELAKPLFLAKYIKHSNS